ISPLRPPPRGPTLFPYTTLFRSEDADCRADEARAGKDEEHRKRRWKCRAEPSEYHPPHRKERRDHSDGDEEIGAAQHRHEVLERSEEHTSELQSRSDLVCRLLLE